MALNEWVVVGDSAENGRKSINLDAEALAWRKSCQ